MKNWKFLILINIEKVYHNFNNNKMRRKSEIFLKRFISECLNVYMYNLCFSNLHLSFQFFKKNLLLSNRYLYIYFSDLQQWSLIHVKKYIVKVLFSIKVKNNLN